MFTMSYLLINSDKEDSLSAEEKKKNYEPQVKNYEPKVKNKN